jgi:MFS family permease
VLAVRRQALGRLWRSPGYPGVEVSATLARLANEMFVVGPVLLVLERTGSASLAGAAAAAFTLPSVLTGPLLGAWIDRRRQPIPLLVADQALSATALVGLVVAADSGAVPVLVLALLAGITSPLSYGGLTSLLPSMVRSEDQPIASDVEAMSFNAATLGGPALAGAIAALVSPEAAVLTQAGLKVAALALLVVAGFPGRLRISALSTRDSIVAGIRHVIHTPPLLAVTLTGALALGGRGLLTIGFPLFAVESLSDDREVGAYLWAAFAIGSIGGIATLSPGTRSWPPARITLAATAACGAVMLIWPATSSTAPALMLVALAGAAYGPGLAATVAVRQKWTPPSLQGQVFTTSASLKPGFFALGAAASGPLTVAAGADVTLAVGGALHLLAAGVGAVVLARAPLTAESPARAAS